MQIHRHRTTNATKNQFNNFPRMIDLLIFALIPEKNTFLFSGSITMTSTQNFAPERRATVKPSNTMRCRVSACSWLNIQHIRTVRHLLKKDDFQKIMAHIFFLIFWEAIFLVDETPHGFNGVFFWKLAGPGSHSFSHKWTSLPERSCGSSVLWGDLGVFGAVFLGTFFGDSKALGRFVFFFFLKFGDSWNFGKKSQDFLNLPWCMLNICYHFFLTSKGGGHGFIGPFWVSTRYIHKTKQDQASGTVPGWYSQGRRIWLRHVSFGKLDKRKETPIRRQESSNESCERGPIGPFSFFSELNYRLGRVSNTWGIG